MKLGLNLDIHAFTQALSPLPTLDYTTDLVARYESTSGVTHSGGLITGWDNLVPTDAAFAELKVENCRRLYSGGHR